MQPVASAINERLSGRASRQWHKPTGDVKFSCLYNNRALVLKSLYLVAYMLIETKLLRFSEVGSIVDTE